MKYPCDAAIDRPAGPQAFVCPNCSAQLRAGAVFCDRCGQKRPKGPPSARQFLLEWMHHYVAADGKLWPSLKALLLQPGLLARTYLDGRQRRFVGPLPLLVTMTLVVVLYSAVQPKTLPAADRPLITSEAVLGESWGPLDHWRVKALKRIGQRNELLAAGLVPPERVQTRSVFGKYFPYALLLLVPIQALVHWIFFYRAQPYYGAHVVVALYSQCGVCLFFIIFLFAAPLSIPWAGDIWFALHLVYRYAETRAAYRMSAWGTLWRSVLVITLYGAAFVGTLTFFMKLIQILA